MISLPPNLVEQMKLYQQNQEAGGDYINSHGVDMSDPYYVELANMHDLLAKVEKYYWFKESVHAEAYDLAFHKK